VGQENLAYVWTVTKGDKSDQYFIMFVFLWVSEMYSFSYFGSSNKDGKVLSSPSDRGSAVCRERLSPIVLLNDFVAHT